MLNGGEGFVWNNAIWHKFVEFKEAFPSFVTGEIWNSRKKLFMETIFQENIVDKNVELFPRKIYSTFLSMNAIQTSTRIS